MADTSKNILDRLKDLFGLQTNPEFEKHKGQAQAKRQPPLTPKKDTLKTPVDDLLGWWLKEVLESEPADRQQRYDEYDFMVKNSSEVALAESTYIDESLQTNKYENPITVNTKDAKLKVWIEKQFRDWKVLELLPAITENLVRYGDAPVAPVFGMRSGGGKVYEIQKLSLIPVRDFEREEAEIRPDKDLAGTLAKVTDLFDRSVAVSQVLDRMYGHHLTGFRINVKNTKTKIWLPPWMLVHFRSSTGDRDFLPYGRGYLEPMRSVYRQLLAGETLMAIARATRFDRLIWKIPVDGADPAEAFQEVVRFMTAYKQNTGSQTFRAQKEITGLAEDIYLPKTQEKDPTVERIGSSVNMDDIADIEYRRDKLYTAARLPKSFLLADQTADLHGDALVAQDEKFARLIFRIQHDLIVGLIRLVQIQMALTGDFDPATADFTIGLPFPVKKFSQEEIQRTRDKFDLVDTAVKTFEDAVNPESQVPLEVFEEFFRLYSELDDAIIKKVMKAVKKARAKAEVKAESEAQDMSGGFGNDPMADPLEDDPMAAEDDMGWESRVTGRDLLSEALTPITEWTTGAYHMVSSRHPYLDAEIVPAAIRSDLTESAPSGPRLIRA